MKGKDGILYLGTESDVSVVLSSPSQAEERIQGFIDDPDEKKLDFPPADQVYRSIL